MSLDLKVKLAKYIITKDNYPNLPRHLDGEILLEEVKTGGTVVGWLTVGLETLSMIIEMAKDPAKRPDIVVEEGEFKGRWLRSLSADEFARLSGYRKYLDRWKKEGIDFGIPGI
jgi:hypothetical protein